MKHFFKIFIVFFVIFSMIFGTSLYLIVAKENDQLVKIPMPDEVPTTVPGDEERVNVLLLGVDSLNGDKKGIRTDTMMVLSMDPKTGDSSILSIPRDTRVKIRGRKGYDKINAAHAYGGVELSVQASKDLLGIPIHHYVKVDYQALYKTVDDVGGVEVYVPMNMKYNDPYATPPLHINLSKGTQVLNGDKAMQFLRFRKGYANQDLGRIESQQKFMDALAKKVLSASSIFRIKDYIDTFNMYVDTDMSVSEMASLGMEAKNIDINNIRKEVVPGTAMYINGISYYNPDNNKINKLVNELYYANNNQNNTDLDIAVLNGSGLSGVATDVSNKLARQGLKPDTVGNADDFNNPKTIIYYDTKKEEAEKIKKIIGKGQLKKDKSKLEDKDMDIIVLIGKDIRGGN
ncbi:LCP family protein [Tepidibacter aestuarii]|uniref:LCP family protein n=1 Tax=Tepidibacter aestuarii TaxID=2925782 RepID=UPI0020BF24CB|nr:LCP family protein [Tepidibacter aestuarii]CAH2214172.1 polyisoprenyl-teichoic acid--peptidoglycan teichoic acid transferase [Tepidibacter aestuarii]